MKLYITATSPYARIARIAVIEKDLESRVEIALAQTRVAGSPYYAVNPSGRVPYLIRADGVGLEDSSAICHYLDHLDGAPRFDAPPGRDGEELRRLEALARSLLDGLAVWGRELRRPVDERSPTTIEHERERARRMTDLWETQVEHPLLESPFNLAQITLVSALQLERRNPDFRWRSGRPKLSSWADRIASRPSLAATAPPPA